MPKSDLIQNVVTLIRGGQFKHAIDTWAEDRNTLGKCAPCFYSPLGENVRCASCLATHFDMSALKRSYPSISIDALDAARIALEGWITQHG